jgi:D-3-phosphoglycerate dehydrogenase
VEKVELDELLRRADFISLHTPKTDHPRHDQRRRLAKMKPGVRIVNCARGGWSSRRPEGGLESGQVAGAALDVFARNRRRTIPLFGHGDRSSHAASGRLHHRGAGKGRVQVAEQMADYLLTGAVRTR